MSSAFSTSVELILGARDTGKGVLANAKKDQQDYEQSLGDTADTSARTTAALALMLQVMGDSPVKELVADLALLKGSLDAVRAAQSKNASGLEKLTAKATLFVAAFSIGKKIGDFFSGGAEAAKKLNDEMERGKKLLASTQSSMMRQFSDEEFKITLVDDPEEQIAKLKSLVQRAENEVQGAIDAKTEAKKSFDVYNTWENNWLRINKDIQKTEKERYENAQSNVELYQGKLSDLQTQLFQMQELEKKAATQRIIENDKKRAEAIQKVKDSIQAEINALKFSREELTLMNLEKERASALDINQVKHLQQVRKELEDKKKAEEEAAAAAKKAAEEKAKAIEKAEQKRQNELLRERNRLEREANSIIQQNLTPLQKFAQEYQKLSETKFKRPDLITDEIFNKQLAKLKEKVKQDSGLAESLPALGAQQDSSRFLARARGADPVKQNAESNKRTAELMAEAKKIFEQINENTRQMANKPAGGQVKVFNGGSA